MERADILDLIAKRRKNLTDQRDHLAVFELFIDELPDTELDKVHFLGIWGEPLQFHLNKDIDSTAQQAFVHALTRLIGVQGEKRKTYDGRALYVLWKGTEIIPDITLYGYVPPTCKVVKKTVHLPAMDERDIEVEEIVCEGGELA